jgi:chemotaxis protein MotB
MRRRGGLTQNAPPTQDYLGSVSDLMSGLIFIFIITVAVFALRLAQTQESLAKTREELTNADTVRERVIESMRRELERQGVEVQVDADQGILRLTDRAIQFDRGAADPAPAYHRNVGIVANVLLRVLRCHVDSVRPVSEFGARAARAGYCEQDDAVAAAYACERSDGGARVNTVLIEGHTDNVPIAGGLRFKDNLDLSAARSSQVLRMMQQCEPELSGLTNRSEAPVLSVSGYGETRPIDRVQPGADANRRIDLRFLMAPPRGDGRSGTVTSTERPLPVEETAQELRR